MHLRNQLTPTRTLEGAYLQTELVHFYIYRAFNSNNTSDLDNKYSASNLTMHWRWVKRISIQTHPETQRSDGCGRGRGRFVIILNVWMSNGSALNRCVGRVPTMSQDKSWASLSMWAASSHIRLLSLFVFMHSRSGDEDDGPNTPGHTSHSGASVAGCAAAACATALIRNTRFSFDWHNNVWGTWLTFYFNFTIILIMVK